MCNTIMSLAWIFIQASCRERFYGNEVVKWYTSRDQVNGPRGGSQCAVEYDDFGNSEMGSTEKVLLKK